MQDSQADETPIDIKMEKKTNKKTEKKSKQNLRRATKKEQIPKVS